MFNVEEYATLLGYTQDKIDTPQDTFNSSSLTALGNFSFDIVFNPLSAGVPQSSILSLISLMIFLLL